jgi:Flp pilus assembly protein TadG
MKTGFQPFFHSNILRKHRLRSESGSALIEAALSITVLLILLFGVIEISLALYSYHFISNAAREGTRYAVVRGSTWGTQCDTYNSAACTASQTDIQNYVQSLAFPGIDSGSVVVTPIWSASLGGTSCPSCNASKDFVQIQVQYTFPLAVPFVSSHSFTMTSTSEMVIAQ